MCRARRHAGRALLRLCGPSAVTAAQPPLGVYRTVCRTRLTCLPLQAGRAGISAKSTAQIIEIPGSNPPTVTLSACLLSTPPHDGIELT